MEERRNGSRGTVRNYIGSEQKQERIVSSHGRRNQVRFVCFDCFFKNYFLGSIIAL